MEGYPVTPWQSFFDERQLKEIDFANTYYENFRHGTDGHHRLIIIGMMSRQLDSAYFDARLCAAQLAEALERVREYESRFGPLE